MTYFVYILYSEKYSKFYIGQTNDLSERIRRHNLGVVISTKSYLPWRMIWACEKSSRSESMQLEKKLKNLSKDRLKLFMEKYTSIPLPM